MQLKYLSVAALAAAASAQTMNLTSALMSNPDLSNLTAFVSAYPQLLSSLSMAKNITILAPSNEAFSSLLSSSAGAAIKANDTTAIQSLLSYHVLNGTYMAAMFNSTPMFIHTMLSNPTYANVTGGQVVEAVTVGKNVSFFSGLLMNATVTKADMNFTGGVIHVVDNVLTEPQNISTTAVEAGLSSAAGALTSANLVSPIDTMMDLTVFVPNNTAFQAIGSALGNLTTQDLASILEYHGMPTTSIDHEMVADVSAVVNGTVGYSSTLINGSTLTSMSGGKLKITIENGTVFVNSAKVILPDVLVSNGVVHVIDNVLNPNATSATPVATASTQMPEFSGASSVSSVPFTSGIPTPTSTLGGGAGGATSSAAAAGGSGTSSSKKAAAMPMQTGAMGAAALFAAGGLWMNV